MLRAAHRQATNPAGMTKKHQCAATATCMPRAPPEPTEAPWYVRWTRWRQQSATEGEAWEEVLLSRCCKTPLKSFNVPVGPGKQDYIHTVSGGTPGKPELVLAPGYAAGLGFYFRQFDALAPHFRLHAIDWLGTGLSGRPCFAASGREATESFFLDSLKKWKEQTGVGKMVLLGHSLGGYLSACYALKYPEDVEHLILVCPAGVPRVPDGWQARFDTMPASRRMLFKTLMWTWDRGLTPGSVIRTLGPLGPTLCQGYVNSRFNHSGDGLSEAESTAFSKYFYQITAAPGSGEFALRHLLAPGAWAHAPLEHRLHELKVPVTFVYGASDWMKPEHAVNLCKRLREDGPPRCSSDKRVEIIDDAGHFVFLEQAELFNRAVIDAAEPVLGKATAGAAAHGMPHASEDAHTNEMSRWSYQEGADGGQAGPAESNA